MAFDIGTGNLIPKTFDSRNKLNLLNGREWTQFLKSWFIADGKPNEKIQLHPATFPPSMIESFLLFFTKPKEWVLDPFVGTGSTLIACDRTKRLGIGIELYEKYVKVAQKRTKLSILQGDCRTIIPQLEQKFKVCITSPPYFNILTKKPDYKQKERKEKGLDLQYGIDNRDIGNITDYLAFLREITFIFKLVHTVLLEKAYLIIIIQNLVEKGGIIPVAFDLFNQLKDSYQFLGEKIWCQNQRMLKPYGYPYRFVPNFHHHYCLIFAKK